LLEDLFAPKTWEHVRKSIVYRVKGSFPRARNEDVDDAVQSAMLSLFATWRHYKSTIEAISDKEKLFNFAVSHGAHRAKEYLSAIVKHNDEEPPVDMFSTEVHSSHRSEMSAEDVYMAQERGRAVAQTEAELSEEDLDRWFLPMLYGEGMRAQARRQGITHEAVRKRRRRGSMNFLERLQELTGEEVAA
jgi:hypothetical protein